MSRRTIRTAAHRDTVIRALEAGHGFATSARLAGISRRALQDWRNDDPAFGEACLEAAEYIGDLAEHTLLRRGIQEGDTLALLAWLRAHRPERYHRRQLVSVGGDLDNPLLVQHQALGSADERVHFFMPDNGRAAPEDDDGPPLIEGEADDGDTAAA